MCKKKLKNCLIAIAMAPICAVVCSPAAFAGVEGKTAPNKTATEGTETAIVEVPMSEPEVLLASLTEPVECIVETAEIVEVAQIIEEPAEIAPTLADFLTSEYYDELEDASAKIVLADISDQRVWAFEDEVVMLEGPMVSGTADTKRETSRGIFQIEFKKHGKYLRGPGWKCWVDYWMLFDEKRSIGFHDASWRDTSEFVPETYLTDGSHGCVNLPSEFAAQLYDFVELGTIVVVQD